MRIREIGRERSRANRAPDVMLCTSSLDVGLTRLSVDSNAENGDLFAGDGASLAGTGESWCDRF